jgi:transposase
MMDNLPSHKVKTITPLIERVGARILHMSRYSPEFNPIEHQLSVSLSNLWSQLKAFLRQFPPTTSKMVDTLIVTAINSKNLSIYKTGLPTPATVLYDAKNLCK